MAWVAARDLVGQVFTDHGGGLRFAPEARSRDANACRWASFLE
jgi:hypothetical protein